MDYNPQHPTSYSASPPHSQPLGSRGGPSSSNSNSGSGGPRSAESPRTGPRFDVIHWYPHYQSCLRYFLEVAQHSYPCQALAAFVNIKLPFQRPAAAGTHHHQAGQSSSHFGSSFSSSQQPNHPTISSFGWVSLHPYIRRLVATGFDVPAILHGWFGDDWESGVGPLHEQERRNYLFAAKSGGWASVKRDYDNVVDEAIPYLKPLGLVEDSEIEAAEGMWSKWLAMEDWMLGSRAPPNSEHMPVGGD